MKKSRNFEMNIGASSILVIIIILTLVCFAGLSLASANADYQLCLKLADRTKAYYEAASEAYIDLSNKKESSSMEDPFVNDYAINNNQVIHVEALFNTSKDKNYVLKSFKINTIKEPELDDSLSLLIK